MPYFKQFQQFIDLSPTAYFCSKTLEQQLKEAGYEPFENLNKNKKIFIRHEGFSAAFCLPKNLKKAHYLLAHTDSPCLKLKPHPLMTECGLSFYVSEPYGSPLLSSYLGKPLRLAGKVALDTPNGPLVTPIEHPGPFFIPDPAIHLSKEANASLDRGKLHVLVGFDHKASLEEILKVKYKILAHDLYLTSSAPLVQVGLDHHILAGPRLDNLSSCFAVMETLKTAKPAENTLYGALFFDHEEIGSQTLHGAHSHLIKQILDKIYRLYGSDSVKEQAFSIDVAHANHPSFPDKFDTQHPIYLGAGVVLKHHVQHKYAQDLELFAYARKKLKTSQIFTMRNEVGTGSTLGPYFSSLCGIPTQDIGLPLLGMHSTTEMIAQSDLATLIDFSQGFFHEE